MAKSQWKPPRGIRYRDFPNRPNPYMLIWGPEPGQNKTYATLAERELAAKDLAQKRGLAGDAVLQFDPERWARFLEFQKIVGEGVDPIVVAHEWRKSKQGKPTAVGLLVKDAIPKYFALRSAEKSWGVDAARHAKTQLARFSDVFGEQRLHEVDADPIRTWLSGLKDKNGEPIGPGGQKDHRKNVSTFFEYAMRERWGAVENPCARITPPKIVEGDPTVISVKDAFAYFKANHGERVLARVALEAFGGIRYTTAGSIQKDGINLESRGIRMAANIHKSGKKDGKARYRQGQPENLWKWLQAAPESCWKMTLLAYREEKRHAAIRAGLRPAVNLTEEDAKKIDALDNVWRHSFISYHLARFKSVPLTQYLAQHQSSRQTQEYEGLADEVDAARYFMINPETVKLSWEEFAALPVVSVKPMDSSSIAAITG